MSTTSQRIHNLFRIKLARPMAISRRQTVADALQAPNARPQASTTTLRRLQNAATIITRILRTSPRWHIYMLNKLVTDSPLFTLSIADAKSGATVSALTLGPTAIGVESVHSSSSITEFCNRNFAISPSTA